MVPTQACYTSHAPQRTVLLGPQVHCMCPGKDDGLISGPVDKVCFLNSPISQAGLFGNNISKFSQEFTAVQSSESSGCSNIRTLSPLNYSHPLLFAEGAHLREVLSCPRLCLWPNISAKHWQSTSAPCPRVPLSTINGLRRVSEKGHLEKRELAHCPVGSQALFIQRHLKIPFNPQKRAFFPLPCL